MENFFSRSRTRTSRRLAARLAHAALIHGTRTVVAEQNQGGKMVAAILRTACPAQRVKLVTATVGKDDAPICSRRERYGSRAASQSWKRR